MLPARQKSGRLSRRPPPGAQSWSGAQPSSGPEAEQTERLLIRDNKIATTNHAAAPFLVRCQDTPCRPSRQPPGRPSALPSSTEEQRQPGEAEPPRWITASDPEPTLGPPPRPPVGGETPHLQHIPLRLGPSLHNHTTRTVSTAAARLAEWPWQPTRPPWRRCLRPLLGVPPPLQCTGCPR